MANTISLAIQGAISGLGISSSVSGSKTITQSGNDFTAQTQVIGFGAAELLDLGTDVSAAGAILAIVNLDSTNFVELSLNDFTQKFAKLLAGEPALIPLSTGTVYAKADTGNVNVAYLLCER